VSVAEANNIGLKIAFDEHADFIAWLYPDAICAPERFET
jgi:GT2 family glycosyltransferase